MSCSQVECCSNLEILWIRIKLDFRYVIVGVCYRPPHFNRSDFNISLYHALGTVTKEFPTDHFFLGGDFNYPEINWSKLMPLPDCSNSRQCTEFLSITGVYGLQQIITSATRRDAILDLFFTNKPECVTSVTIMKHISDHALIQIETSLGVTRSENTPKKIFAFSRTNIERLTVAITNFERYYISSNCDRSASENWVLIKILS